MVLVMLVSIVGRYLTLNSSLTISKYVDVLEFQILLMVRSIDCDEVRRVGRVGLVSVDCIVVFSSSIILFHIDLFSSSRASFRVFHTNSHRARKKAITVPPMSTTKMPPTLSIPNSTELELDFDSSCYCCKRLA